MRNLLSVLCGANGGNLWTPAQIPGLLFWLQAPRVGSTTNLTIVGGKVSAAADAAGGATVLAQGTAGRRPTFNTAEFIDGYTSIETNYAADTELKSATGGLVGDVAHTLVTIGSFISTPAYQASNQGLMQFGPAAPSASSVLGNNNTGVNGEYWFGGGPGTGTPGGGSIITDDVTLAHKTYTPGSELGYLDGVQVASGANALPITDATILMGSTFNAGAFANPDYKILTRLWISGVIGASPLAQLYQWARQQYPTAFPSTYGFLGDSNTAGSGPVTPTDTFGYLACQARSTRQWQSATYRLDLSRRARGAPCAARHQGSLPRPDVSLDARDERHQHGRGHGDHQGELREHRRHDSGLVPGGYDHLLDHPSVEHLQHADQGGGVRRAERLHHRGGERQVARQPGSDLPGAHRLHGTELPG